MNWKEQQFYQSRKKKTLELMKAANIEKAFDLGDDSPMRKYLQENGFHLSNLPGGKDLNKVNFSSNWQWENFSTSTFTAFEVLERIFSPYHLLISAQPEKIICTVPLKIPFVPIHWSSDKRDRHYHEFEEKQFIWMLEEAGYQVVKKERWYYTGLPVGIRTILRYLFPSWLAVIAIRKY